MSRPARRRGRAGPCGCGGCDAPVRGAVLPVASYLGITSFWPGRSAVPFGILLASAIAEAGTPNRFTRLSMVSPCCTVVAVRPPSSMRAWRRLDCWTAPAQTKPRLSGRRPAGCRRRRGGRRRQRRTLDRGLPLRDRAGHLARGGLHLDDRKIRSDSKRWVSELQLTAATEIDPSTARRNNRSERPGSSTRRIGLSHSYATGPRES